MQDTHETLSIITPRAIGAGLALAMPEHYVVFHVEWLIDSGPKFTVRAQVRPSPATAIEIEISGMGTNGADALAALYNRAREI